MPARRGLLVGFLFLSPSLSFGRGMVGRGVAAAPKPKPSGRTFPVSFTGVAAAAGLKSPRICGAERKKYIVESMGQGVAYLDYNGDGWPDIFLVNGSRFDASGETKTLTNHRYRNNRNGTFIGVTADAGMVRSGWGQSVTVADYDNDGFIGLFVSYWGHNVFYHNNGNGTFTDVSARAGAGGERIRWGSGAAWFDYDRDGYLDLFVANYLELDPRRTPWPGADPNCAWLGLPVICGPRGLPFSSHLLCHNNRDGTFTDVSSPLDRGLPPR